LTWSPLVLLVCFVAGVFSWGAFNWSMELTNSESFCISCHEMERNVYQEYRQSVHYTNATGVRATCPDCHVPREWVHKVVRKLRATNELYHWVVGSVNSREKFEAKRLQLATHVWQEMGESDSRECRNCHGEAFMVLEQQSPMAGKLHKLSPELGLTCIDCHQGVAHALPAQFDKEAQLDELHIKLEQLGAVCQDCQVECYICHEGMQQPESDEPW